MAEYSNLNGDMGIADLRSCMINAKIGTEAMNAECGSVASTRAPTPASSGGSLDSSFRDTECEEPESAKETIQDDRRASDSPSAVLIPKRPGMAHPSAKPRFQRHHHSAVAPPKDVIPFAQCRMSRVRRDVDFADISVPEFLPRRSALGSVNEVRAKLAVLAAAGKALCASWPARHAKAAFSASPTQLRPAVTQDALAIPTSKTATLLPRRLRSVAALEETKQFKSKDGKEGKSNELSSYTEGPLIFSNMSTDGGRPAFSSY